MTDAGQMTAPLGFDVLAVRNVTGPPRLIREMPEPMFECPGCGLRVGLGTAGATWTIRSPRDVTDRLIFQLGSLEREELHVLHLNTKNVVVGQERVYVGNVSASLVRVAELFTGAVRRCAPRILLVHNHPSGDPTPSVDDLNLTANAIAAGRLLDIELLDHIVVGRDSWVSLCDRGAAFERQ